MHVSSLTSPLSLDPTSNSYNSLIINNNNHNHNHINSYCKTNNNNFNFVPQFFITALILGLGFLFLFRSRNSAAMSDTGGKKACVMCGEATVSWCAACKKVYYCSSTCQLKHWKSEHKANCKGSSGRLKSQHKNAKPMTSIALVPDKLVDKVLFSYDVFLKLFDWDLPAFAPCGLLNCGNSCFANVVLQCLAHTRPLVAYLLKKGHRRDCRRNEWCFLCELEAHMDRVVISQQPFSPINILSRLPSMGGNMGYGRQEDAHEFMRFAIDMMQSVCLDVHGGEKIIHPKSQETTLIQHIFGGQLRSQVKCTKCYQVSDRYENMMDLTVEIQGDITSLQECLDQFTETELLHGENKYKCDRCKDYVVACKRLTIHQAPNILTVTLKRFQGGNFGKINKKVAFPESLDLCPYMSEERDDTDKYELYAVVVHMDMLNASFFGHYICYTKGFQGDWYWIDDCKVTRVELDEVLSQGAYMLMYKRISARPKCLKTSEVGVNKQTEENKMASVADNISLSQLSSPSSSSDSGRKKECEGYKGPAVADDISPSHLPSSSNSSDPCMKELEGDKMVTLTDDISQSQPPSSSCMKEHEGDKMVTLTDDISQSQPPSSSCMKEHEGDKMVTLTDDFSQSQPPSSSNCSDAHISNLTTTVEKEQLEPLVSLSLAASHESIGSVSEDHSTVLPVSDGCELSEPASNKKP